MAPFFTPLAQAKPRSGVKVVSTLETLYNSDTYLSYVQGRVVYAAKEWEDLGDLSHRHSRLTSWPTLTGDLKTNVENPLAK
jgi:hypothetical protein